MAFKFFLGYICCIYLLPFCGLSFTPLLVSFAEQKLLILIKLSLSICFPLQLSFKEIFAYPRYRRVFSFVFFQKLYCFTFYIYFFQYSGREVYFFQYGYSVDPASLAKMIILSSLHWSITFVMNHVTVYVCVYFLLTCLTLY